MYRTDLCQLGYEIHVSDRSVSAGVLDTCIRPICVSWSVKYMYQTDLCQLEYHSMYHSISNGNNTRPYDARAKCHASQLSHLK